VDLSAEKAAGDAVRALIRSGAIRAVHDLSDGGLFIAAAEMAMATGVGLALSLNIGPPLHAALFGEDQGRYLLCVDPAKADMVFEALETAGVPAEPIGVAGGCELAVQDAVAIDIADLRAAHEGWMPGFMG
jgi:phosphoribosylformylglycinamidine synthase subunit PurL